MYMSILPACMSVHRLSAWCLWKPEVVSHPVELGSQAVPAAMLMLGIKSECSQRAAHHPAFKKEVSQSLETL